MITALAHHTVDTTADTAPLLVAVLALGGILGAVIVDALRGRLSAWIETTRIDDPHDR